MKYLRLLLLCLLGWWPMMAVHELGHVIGCVFSGARIERVVLWPWTISQTVRSHSGAPLIDTWFGPLFGVIAPAIVYWLVRKKRFPGRAFLGFLAGFCFIANGLYLGLGWLNRIGDAGDLLRHGASKYTLIVFGMACVAAGLVVWNAELFQNEKFTPQTLTEQDKRRASGGAT